ncbi:unnamed protein product [Thlaspi arvense]|uniref:DUF4283 domain-containing protein n=1 Tax=Thlaspi arvense TaxID=13288 RepID=A0AAU9RY33_THLAR|nr:unnamed protein product [Thlaspi arvense]
MCSGGGLRDGGLRWRLTVVGRSLDIHLLLREIWKIYGLTSHPLIENNLGEKIIERENKETQWRIFGDSEWHIRSLTVKLAGELREFEIDSYGSSQILWDTFIGIVGVVELMRKHAGKQSTTVTTGFKIKIPKFDNSKLIESYSKTLIGRCLNPQKQDVKSLLYMMPRIWKIEEKVAGADLGLGRFQFDFDEETDIIEVLKMEPFHFDYWMVSLVRWKPVVDPNYPSAITFWVRVVGVLLQLWTEPTFRGIGEALGEVKEVDIDEGRIRVVMDGGKPLIFDSLVDFDNGEELPITLRYERLFGYCRFCHSLCHDHTVCLLNGGNNAGEAEERRQANTEMGVRATSYKGAVVGTSSAQQQENELKLQDRVSNYKGKEKAVVTRDREGINRRDQNNGYHMSDRRQGESTSRVYRKGHPSRRSNGDVKQRKGENNRGEHWYGKGQELADNAGRQTEAAKVITQRQYCERQQPSPTRSVKKVWKSLFKDDAIMGMDEEMMENGLSLNGGEHVMDSSLVTLQNVALEKGEEESDDTGRETSLTVGEGEASEASKLGDHQSINQDALDIPAEEGEMIFSDAEIEGNPPSGEICDNNFEDELEENGVSKETNAGKHVLNDKGQTHKTGFNQKRPPRLI